MISKDIYESLGDKAYSELTEKVQRPQIKKSKPYGIISLGL